MEKFLLILRLLADVTPVLINAIKAVEEALPGSGMGAQKLAIVRSMLESAYQNYTDTKIAFDDVWPSIQKLIQSIIATYNTVGVFKK
jgi:hypothetical protein